MTTNSKYLTELQQTSNSNVFIMMRYRRLNPHFIEIEECIRKTLKLYGLIGRLAKDSAIVDDIWGNIVLYMEQCRFGIVVYEDIDEREFNPNISLELGYMYATGKRCLLLKEERMPRLPTDICGKIYKDFDALNLSSSIEKQIHEWCKNDLGLKIIDESLQLTTKHTEIIYDNQSEDPDFRTWGVFATDGLFMKHIVLKRENDTDSDIKIYPFIELSADSTESVGINKYFDILKGKVRFEYKAIQSTAENPNLLFCMIPMQGKPYELLEVGAKVTDEPANAFSPYRERYFVPEWHIGDNLWHQTTIDFDFKNTPKASYSIFAPRINEGCPRPGGGKLQVKNIEIFI